MNQIQINVGPAAERLRKLRRDLSDKEISMAAKLALNDGVRKGFTLVRKGIQDTYNIKSKRIVDPNPKKGLTASFATNNNLTAQIKAGHIPVNLINIDGNQFIAVQSTKLKKQVKWKGKRGNKAMSVGLKKKRSVVKGGGISVEVIKGQRKVIYSAFTIGRFTQRGRKYAIPGKAVFARGKKAKVGFAFGRSRMPIDSLSNISIGAAATNVKVKVKYEEQVNDYATKRFDHHVKRLVDKALR